MNPICTLIADPTKLTVHIRPQYGIEARQIFTIFHVGTFEFIISYKKDERSVESQLLIVPVNTLEFWLILQRQAARSSVGSQTPTHFRNILSVNAGHF